MSLHGGNIREALQKYQLTGGKVIDFSASINPLGFPQSLNKIIFDNLNNIQHYPDPDCADVKNALSQYLGVSKNNLLVGNGSIELIYLITLALRPERVLIQLPAFSEYERAALAAGGKCLFLKAEEKNGFEINVAQVLKSARCANLIFICNPNNPTGFLFDKEAIMSLAKGCEKKGVFLVIDEVFMDFVEEKIRASLLKFASKSKYVMALQSLTKFFAISGLRLGYLAAGKELIKKISLYQPPWSVNSIAQLAGASFLKDNAFISRSRQYVFKQRKELFAELIKIKYIKPYPANANFIFCKILNKKMNSARLSDYCGKKGVVIRDCANFRGLGNSFIRIAVRKKEENAKLIRILKELE